MTDESRHSFRREVQDLSGVNLAGDLIVDRHTEESLERSYCGERGHPRCSRTPYYYLFATGNTTPAEAAVKGSLIRFRPIMMTTMAAIMGTLPIALGTGAGANSRRPLGLSVVGGLIFAQIVTLYLTPVFYTYMDSFQTWLRRGRHQVSGTRRLALSHEPLLAPHAKRAEENS